MMALIGTQIYWVRNTARLQEEDLNKKIAGILDDVAVRTEDLTHAFYLYSRSYIQAGQGISVIKKNRDDAATDTLQLFNAFPYSNRPDTCFYVTNTSYYDAPVIVNATLRFEYIHTGQTPDISEKNKTLSTLGFDNFRERLRDDLPIATRIKTAKLDSLIRVELTKAGLYNAFTYGLRKKGDKQYEYLSDSSFLNKRNIKTYNALLFEDIAYTRPYELVLLVQNNEGFINKALTGALGTSSLIILLLAAAFIYFAHTVLKQKRLSQMKTDFINNMTHEFMTPVTNIALALETLEKNTDPKNEPLILNVIETENVLLKENINKILQVAILDKGDVLLDLARIDVHELLHRIVKSFSVQMENKNGMFEFNLNAENPAVIADETHIINLFYNIIDNAVKYAADRPLTIKISSGFANKRLWVSVEDNGIGMDSVTRKNIFEKFYRGATGDKHDVKGFGLGLSYVKSIAAAHNIEIDVASTQGKGTIFTIWFDKQ